MEFTTMADKISAVSDVYAGRFAIERDEAWHLAKLSEELGELTQAYLRKSGRGRQAEDGTAPPAAERLADETADLFAQVVLFARWQNIDLEAALQRKWFKYLEP